MLRPILLILALLTAAAAAAPDPAPVPTVKAVESRRADPAPAIDGAIEDLWLSGDSATGFVQHSPYEKTDPTERTVVYLLQDDANLYVAFRCWAEKHPPVACLTKDEDYVTVKLDPFGSRTNGYFFLVYGSGLFWDGLIMDDGRTRDQTWEGVWQNAVKLYPDRMEVEMRIPFKTLRYKKGLSQWGIQFARHIAASFEEDYWTEVNQKDGDMVSRWGTLTGVDARSSGYYFELFPEGFVRYEQYRDQADEAKPKASLTVKWDITPQTTLNATAYPDFAQIESDPSSINLSRYPTFLQELRPFFVEGQDVFRLSSFNDGGWFQPLNIFYSRRLGRAVDGQSVPIVGGLKLTHKTPSLSVGGLAAYTDRYEYEHFGIDATEPAKRFGLFRVKQRVFRNSDIGLLASAMSLDDTTYNYAVGMENVLRMGNRQLIVQAARSDRDGKRGWAVSSGFRGFFGQFMTMASYEAVGDSFDVRDIGYVPWSGRQRWMAMSGPFWTYRSGPLRNFYVAPGINRTRQPGTPAWSTLGYVAVNPSFRNNMGANLELDYGRNYEQVYDLATMRNTTLRYTYRGLGFNFWGLLMGNNINGGCNYNYSLNYRNGFFNPFLAYQGFNWLTASYSITPPWSVTMSVNAVLEWDADNEPLAMTTVLRPRSDYRITPYMTLSAFDEMVLSAPQHHPTLSKLQTNRAGMIYSWNFRPKSWLYVAINDFSALQPEVDRDGQWQERMRHQYLISAVKVKYLLYF